MADHAGTTKQEPSENVQTLDPIAMGRALAAIAERSRRLVGEFLERTSREAGSGEPDPFNIGQAFFDMTQRLMADPERLVQAQMALWQSYAELWQRTAKRFRSEEHTSELQSLMRIQY